MKKILVVLPFSFYQSSGSSLSSYYRIKALLDLDYAVDILTYPFGEVIKAPHLRIIRSPKRKIFKTFQPGEYRKKFVFDHFMFWKYLSLILRNNYDLIVIHGSMIYSAIFLKWIKKGSLIANAHGNVNTDLQKWGITRTKFLIKLSSKLEGLILKLYDRVVCEHSGVMKILLENGVPANKTDVIEIAVFSKSTLNKDKAKQRGNDKFIVLYTGTFVKIQNLTLIYQTARRIKDNNIEFWLVGGIEKELENEMQMIEKYDVKNNVKLFSRRSQSDLESFYKEADVVVSPRIFGHDTPMKIFDYMNYGKCILATDAPIHTDVLNKSNSYLEKGDQNSFARAILYLKNNPEIVKRSGKKAKDYFENHHNFDMMKTKYQNLLKKII